MFLIRTSEKVGSRHWESMFFIRPSDLMISYDQVRSEGSDLGIHVSHLQVRNERPELGIIISHLQERSPNWESLFLIHKVRNEKF